MLRATQQFVDVLGEGDGKLRATQQFVDVLGEGNPGTLRAAQQYVMILVPAPSTFRVVLEDILALDQVADQRDPHIRITQDLNLVQKAPATYNLFGFNTLVFDQRPSRVLEAEIESELDLEYTWTHENVFFDHLSTHSFLSLTGQVQVDAGLFAVALSTLVLTSDAVGKGPIKQSFRHRLHLLSSIPFQDHFAKLTTPLKLVQRLGRVLEEDVESVLALIDEVFRLFTPDQLLNLSQTVEFEHIRNLLNHLELTHQIDLSAVRDRLSAHTLELGQSLLFWYRDKCITKAYQPLIGEGKTGQPEPPLAQIPPAHPRPTEAAVVLTYPATGEGDYSVSLRAPNLDNKDRQTFTRINRETMGGRLTIFTDPTWPKLHTLLLSFSGLSTNKVSELQDFLLHSLGQLVMLHDWEGRHWVGVIITPSDQIVADGKHGYTATFEFQGELVENPGMGNGLGLAQHVTVTVE